MPMEMPFDPIRMRMRTMYVFKSERRKHILIMLVNNNQRRIKES